MANINMKNPRYGGFWIRFSAMFWDGVILGIPAFIIQIHLISLTGMSSMTYLVTFAVIVITIYMDGIKGGTPGKLILGLRIRNEKGEFIGIPLAILRYIGKILSGIILGIGYLMIAWTKRKQGLHDKIAGTFVIKEPNVERKSLAVIGIVLGLIFIVVPPIFIISSLTYFGVMRPIALLPERCTLPEGITCVDLRTTTDGTTQIQLRNGLGFDAQDVTVSIENECTPRNTEIKNGESLSFTCSGTSGKSGDAYRQLISIDYINADTGLTDNIDGNFYTRYRGWVTMFVNKPMR